MLEFELGTLALGMPGPSQLLNILIVALGLGLVIFFHELGHFLVAKWCGVYVERFSIGFGQPILRKKWGETEYVLAWLPFGGYVKMLGQDDMDPSQMTDEQVSENPRSYTAKSVPQRMAIISAGVIMNVITATLFFTLVFHWGIDQPNRVIGVTHAGLPAWKYGIRAGDTITEINGRQIKDFNDIKRRTAFSSGSMNIRGFRSNGDTFQVKLNPQKDKKEILKVMGVGPNFNLSLRKLRELGELPPVMAGTAAAKAGFQAEDTILAVNGSPVKDSWQLRDLLYTHRSSPVEIQVQRKGPEERTSTATLTLPPENFLDFGLQMNMGKVAALRQGDVAEQAGMKVGDQIAKVNDLNIGADLNPIRLTEYFSQHAGEPVQVTVTRAVEEGPLETVVLTMVPNAVNPWSEPPEISRLPTSIPSIGAAFEIVPVIYSVDPEGPAAKAKIAKRDVITQVTFSRPPADSAIDWVNFSVEPYIVKIGEDEKNWSHAFWVLQANGRTRNVTLTVKGEDGKLRDVAITPQPVADWYLPTLRGVVLHVDEIFTKAEDIPQAAGMGASYALNSIEDIYLTLRGLFTRDISVLGLSGPIDIAKTAYYFADMGLTYFVLFLGVISINLAVINFLPIPVLDGGHMVFLLWEAIFRRKPSEKVVATATYFGLTLVLSLMIFVIILDLFVKRG